MVSSFKEEYETIADLGADVIAISPDTVDSHASFCESLGGCPFPLASDRDLAVARMYGAVEPDGQHPVRAVFVLDERGTVSHRIPWYQPGNVGQLLELFHALGLE